MRRIKSKNAQAVFGLSFSMIFSILLIIVFVALAIYIIIYFLNLKKCTQIGMFLDDLQDSVNEVFYASSKLQEFSQPLSKDIEYICFVDFSKPKTNNDITQQVYDDIKKYDVYEANLYLYPSKKTCNMPYYNLKNIDLDKITINKNPYCIKNNGKPVLKLSKGDYDALVKIE